MKVTCTGCGATLNLKDEFAGRRFKCPRCQTVLTAPMPEPTTQSAPAVSPTSGDSPSGITALPKLGRFNAAAVYLLLGAEKMVGQWKLESGWQVKGTRGLVPAKTNTQDIPASGKFVLVELICEKTEEGKKLKKMSIFRLGSPDAAKRIAGEATAILALIAGYSTLNKNQKNEVLAAIKTLFMREVWGNSEKIREYLLGFDAHSSVIEE